MQGYQRSWRAWAKEALLPCIYWAHQVTRTRCARKRAKLRQGLGGEPSGV